DEVLGLDVGDDGVADALDDKTKAIGAPQFTSAEDQNFVVGGAAQVMSPITVTEYGVFGTVTAVRDLRIRIPVGFPMTWLTSTLTATLGGTAAAKVSPAATYEDAGRTLRLDVLADFAPGEVLTIAGLGYANFASSAPINRLELVLAGAGGGAAARDGQVISIGAVTISSAANQTFSVGDTATAISLITITDDPLVPTINSGKEIRIRIPTGFPMTWNTAITTVTLGGSAASKVRTQLKAYEDGGRTVVVDVNVNFAAGDVITLSGLQFINFTAAASDRLGLDVNNDKIADALDDKTKTIVPGGFTTTLGNGVDPANVTVAPGGPATTVDAFTFQTASGTDALTQLEVALATGTTTALSLLQITDSAGTLVYGSVANPTGDTVLVALSTSITVTSTLSRYRVRITPKSHAAMPVPPGASYAVTARITGWSGTYPHLGSDASSATVTVDNLSPGNVTAAVATAGIGQAVLVWANPVDADLATIIVLRRASAAVVAVPVEGATYVLGDSLGASAIACVVAAPGTTCTDTALPGGIAYHYRIFTRDTNGNFSNGLVPTGSPVTALTPNLLLVKNVSPAGNPPPGTDLAYSTTFTNSGSAPAQSVVIIDPVPANTDFKVASATTNLGTTGLTVVVAYSSDGGTTWTYTPVSAAGGAPVGYDRLVTHVRWTFTGSLSQTAPNNSGSAGATMRVR
ncbi:MAG: hypothetical protein OEW77_10825, partial [Gemmatimonadota bacterium]|nr:hypothetical protein [Gemmatimonadota bacterium]